MRIYCLDLFQIFSTAFIKKDAFLGKQLTLCPFQRKKQPKDVKKDLRSISLTSLLSKVAKAFVVEEHMKPAILANIKNNQLGTIPMFSTTQALIAMIHKWTKLPDGNSAVVLFDYRKAFDLIDHIVLAGKLTTLNIPHKIKCWIIDFLKCRKQRVKLVNELPVPILSKK